MSAIGSGSSSVLFTLRFLGLSKAVLLLFCSKESVDGVQEFDLLDEFFAF